MKEVKQDCIIHTYFVDANNPQKERARYCEKNCNYRCLNGEEYKRKEVKMCRICGKNKAEPSTCWECKKKLLDSLGEWEPCGQLPFENIIKEEI